MDLDDVLPEIGEFGRYQKLVLLFILLPSVFPCGFHAYNQLFMAATPTHRCRTQQERDAIDSTIILNTSLPFTHNGDGINIMQCYSTEDERNQSQGNVNENRSMEVTEPCKYGWIYDRSIYKETIVTEWNLVCEKDLLPTLALVLLGVGGLIGSYLFGYIQDRAGRKPAFFIYLIIETVFGIATAFAPNFWTWALFRVGVGFTVPAILATPYVLAVELVGPRERTLVTILINIAYSVALVTLALIAWCIRDWRTLSLATALPFLTFFGYWWVFPESPRWLLAQGKYVEAEKILTRMARVNGKKKPQDMFAKLKNIPVQPENNYGVADLFRTPNLRWKTIIITFIWFTNTSVYVGLSYYAPSLGGDQFLNFFLAGAVEFPTYLFLWPALEKLGRRWTLCSSMIIGGTACLATFLVNDTVATLVLYCVGKMGISSSFVVLPLMASELYPTVVRGLGMSISSVMGMLGPIFIPLVNYLGSEMLTLPLIIMGMMLVLGGICALLLPETLNKHLPQTLDDGEATGLEPFFCCQVNKTFRLSNCENETSL